MLVFSLSCANRRTQALQSLPRQGFWFTSNHKLAHASNQVEDRTWATWKAKAALLGHLHKKFLIAQTVIQLGGLLFPWEGKAQKRKRMRPGHPHYAASEMFYLHKRRSGPMDRWPVSTWGTSAVLLARTLRLSFTKRDSVHKLHGCSMAVTTPK